LTGETIPPSEPARPPFAHASEAEMARILDFYEVTWEYEPHVYPLRWNMAGEVVESFAPDFYLPDLDLYVELTTLKQRLVRKKNRKLRRLRALYPDLRIKLFYARDFRALMLKYGRIGLVDELSGTPGHLGPDRDESVPDGAAVDLATVASPANGSVPPVKMGSVAASSARALRPGRTRRVVGRDRT
jgi:hypothetical protein